MSLAIEYGPASSPLTVDDPGASYIKVGLQAGGQEFRKDQVKDLVKHIAQENKYNPARKYVTKCMTSVPPCPYFNRLATTLIGVEEDDRTNPVMPSGNRYADEVLKRFFIGSAARLFSPWMPARLDASFYWQPELR